MSATQPPWVDWAAPLASGGLTLGITLPLISGAQRLQQDAAEFALLAEYPGVAHPPGYPVWTALVEVVAALPGWTLHGRLALLCAVLSAIAAAGVTVASRTLGASGLVAAGVGVAFATVPAVWRQAMAPEVYALLLALAAWAWAAWLRSERGVGWSVAAGALTVAACTHHLTAGLLVPGWALLAWAGLRDRKRLVGALTGGLAVAGVWAALVARMVSKARDPNAVWVAMELHDTTLGSVLRFVSGHAFWGFVGQGETTERSARLLLQGGVVALALYGLGLGAVLWTKPRRAGVALSVASVPVLAFGLLYDVPDIEQFALLGVLTGALSLAAGLGRLTPAEGRLRLAVGAGVVVGALARAAMVAGVFNPQASDEGSARLALWADHVPDGAVAITETWQEGPALMAHNLERGAPFYIWMLPAKPDVACPIHDYLSGARPIAMYEQRRLVEPGRQVVVLGTFYVDALADQGLGFEPLGEGVWSVHVTGPLDCPEPQVLREVPPRWLHR
jgi:hypothetical protein